MRQRSDDRSPRNVSALWGLTGPALGPSYSTHAWGFFFSLGDLGFVEFSPAWISDLHSQEVEMYRGQKHPGSCLSVSEV